jgi:hypothetical protein
VAATIDFHCVTCRWFDQQHKTLPQDDPDLGYCRKHKPGAVSEVHDTGTYLRGVWTLVDRQDFCGEFRLKDEAA